MSALPRTPAQNLSCFGTLQAHGNQRLLSSASVASSTCCKDGCGAAEDEDQIHFILSLNSINHSLAVSAME